MSDRCPDCGSELEDFVEGSSMGQRCSGCGWSLVTTFAPPILEDERDYTISLLPGSEATPPGVLRAVSRLAGCNYVAAKGMLLEGPWQLFTGRAAEVLEKWAELERAGVAVEITPEFPYDLDGKSLSEVKAEQSFSGRGVRIGAEVKEVLH